MSKIDVLGKITREYKQEIIDEILTDISAQLNQLSEGRIQAKYLARTAVPAAGDWKKGDLVSNSAPAEAGTAGGMYVIMGWICTASGTPGTWKEMRVLTGN